MTTGQLVFGWALVCVLIAMATFFTWRQGVAIRRLRRRESEIPEEEARFQRRQISRRLTCGVLLAVLAVLLAVAMVFLEEPTLKLAQRGIQNAADRELFRAYGAFWGGFLLVLLGLLVLAGADTLATRRHGLSQLRRLQAERRAMIEEEAALLRRRRNQRE